MTCYAIWIKECEAKYQRAMNAIFHDMINNCLEVYIDDVVVKSKKAAHHLGHLKNSFIMIRQHNLKLNPLKCYFCVQAGNFLSFLVHQREVKIY